MPLVPDPNCDGRGWIALPTGGVDANGDRVYTAIVPDPRCGGSGMVWIDEVFPQSLATVYAEQTAAGIPGAGSVKDPLSEES
jgi:hypothetical protein